MAPARNKTLQLLLQKHSTQPITTNNHLNCLNLQMNIFIEKKYKKFDLFRVILK